MSELQGGKFGHGFWAAGFTQAFSGPIGGIDSGTEGFSPARVVAAAIVGGTASELSGGKFANGAMTGAFSRAFNDEAHGFLHNVRTFVSGLNRVVDVQVSAGAQIGIKTSIPGGAKVELTLNGLAVEKELTEALEATTTREFGVSVGVPIVGDFSLSSRETDILGLLPGDTEYSVGFRKFSLDNEGSGTLSVGVAAGIGVKLDIHLDRIYEWYKSHD